MTKLEQALVARVLEAKTQTELNQVCHDVDVHFDKGAIKWQDHELLFRLINKLYPYDGAEYKLMED